ncbi:MAG TPA: SGNH/GDSL hydrolase family protein [Thermoanaerobaculia bacterium]|nr:SGNH/GDSL hydrolase family protein [Thermoanaerobaculia bacterium]
MRRYSIVLLSLLALALPALGQADFTRYVALGDSLTAGYQSGGLAGSISRNSYPALISKQARPGLAFDQPLVSDPGIPAVLQLVSLSGPTILPKAGTGTLTNPRPGPYNNLGVPGANVRDTVATVTGGLHDLVLQSFNPALRGKPALAQAVQQSPTFVTIWIGNNDVLGAATSGVVIEGVTITPVARFETDLRAIASAINATGAKMAFANIPDVTTIPFVNTVPRFVVNPATSQPVLINGQPVPLIGPNGPLVAGDHVLLTATTELRAGKGIPAALGGTGQPLSNTSVLNVAETATISARVAAYNNVIAAVANEHGAALVDVNGVLRQAAITGIAIGGVTYTPAFLTGGIFSFDGVHPTSFGYAYIANVWIQAINAKFGGNIPLVDLGPFVFGGASATAGGALAANDTEAYFSVLFSEEAKHNLFSSLNIPENPQSPPPPPKGGRGHRRH